MRRALIMLTIAASIAAASPAASAAVDGGLDVTFGDAGMLPLGEAMTSVVEILPLENGGAVVVGASGDWPEDLAVTRVDRRGQIDPSFGVSGFFHRDDRAPADAVRLPGGEIAILGGGYLTVLTPDGRPDETFGNAGQTYLSEIAGTSLALDAAGGFIMAREYRVARLHRDGSLDKNFGDGGFVDIRGWTPTYPGVPGLEGFKTCRFGSRCEGYVSDVTVAPDGSLIAVGALVPDFRTHASDAVVAWGLNAGGEVDAAFGDGGRFLMPAPAQHKAAAVELEWAPDGTPRIAAWEQKIGVHRGVGKVIALDADGRLVEQYGDGGVTTTSHDYLASQFDLSVDPTGQAYLTGYGLAMTGEWVITAFTRDGAIDFAFGEAGMVRRDTPSSDFSRTAGITTTGRLLVGGFTDGRSVVAAYVVDPTGGCTIVGTDARDVLRGSARDDVICGLGGDDTLFGNGGSDILWGGWGRDHLHAKDGDALIDHVIGEGDADNCTTDLSDKVFSCP